MALICSAHRTWTMTASCWPLRDGDDRPGPTRPGRGSIETAGAQPAYPSAGQRCGGLSGPAPSTQNGAHLRRRLRGEPTALSPGRLGAGNPSHGKEQNAHRCHASRGNSGRGPAQRPGRGVRLRIGRAQTAPRQHLSGESHARRALAAGCLRRLRRQPSRLPSLQRNPSRLLPDPGRRPAGAAARGGRGGSRGRSGSRRARRGRGRRGERARRRGARGGR